MWGLEDADMPRPRMRLMAGLETGPTMNHVGTWRHPDTDNAFLTPEGWEHIARVLEAGCFDGVFLAEKMRPSNPYSSLCWTNPDSGPLNGLFGGCSYTLYSSRDPTFSTLSGCRSTSRYPLKT